MAPVRLLLIARDYLGTTTQLVTSAQDITAAWPGVEQVVELYGDQVTTGTTRALLASFLEACQPDQDAVVYVACHGNQFPDLNGDESDGLDEAMTLPDGIVLDDALCDIVSTHWADRPGRMLVFISDHCSSGSMLDHPSCTSWVSVGATLDPQDALVDGDGSLLSQCICQVLAQRPSTLGQFRDCLAETMRESWAGELQVPSFHAGSPACWDRKVPGS